MSHSPGVDAVITLAAQEVIAAKMEEIQPEHIICGILKFSELPDDVVGEGNGPQRLQQAFIMERDHLRKLLDEKAIDSTLVRRELRKRMGKGHHRYEGGAIHRSTASRRLFDDAQRLAHKANNVLTCEHLLRVLLDSPTSLIQQVLEGQVIPKRKMSPQGNGPLPPYIHNFIKKAQHARYSIPKHCEAQVQAVLGVLNGLDRSPVVLVCAPKTEILPIIGSAVQNAENGRQVFDLECCAILQKDHSREGVDSAVSDLLVGLSEDQGAMLFINLTGCSGEESIWFLSAIQPAISGNMPSFLIALAEMGYHEISRTHAELVKKLKPIWIHEIANTAIPFEI
jgi:hypothetical protein